MIRTQGTKAEQIRYSAKPMFEYIRTQLTKLDSTKPLSESDSDATDKERAGNTFRLPAREYCNGILFYFCACDRISLVALLE